MKSNALLIGNSDGIGLALTKELLQKGWKVTGISRSNSPITDASYKHVTAEVQSSEYPRILEEILTAEEFFDTCVYCAGIGEKLDPADMSQEVNVFEVNLMGMIKTAACVIPLMVKRKKGHFIGLSSVLDDLVSPVAASYHASKAAFTSYLEGLAIAARPFGVHVTNVRFGFVNTKLPRGNIKPFMISLESATRHMIACMEKKPIRYTAPWRVTPVLKCIKWMSKFRRFQRVQKA